MGLVAAPFTPIARELRERPVAVAVSASTATDTTVQDTTVFVAALQADLVTLKPLLPALANASTPEGYTPLSLAVSAGHVDVCRLLLREGASANAQDRTGVTALMHACMHGFAELAELLLLHGAQPRLHNAEGQNAASLAARYGRPASLGTLFRADASLVEATDELGRTPLHWAAVSGHVPSMKYVLGRWGAHVEPVDAQGNTPLHLVGGSQEVLLLLVHGTATRPSLTRANKSGQTPAEAAAAAGAASIAELMRSPEDADPELGSEWLQRGGAQHDRRLFSFLVHSPMRTAPSRTLQPSWLQHASAADVIFALSPLVPPKLIAHGFEVTTALGGFVLVVCISSTLHSLMEHRASPLRIGGATGVNAGLLFGIVAAASYIYAATLLPYATDSNARAVYGTLFALVGYWTFYLRVQALDPGFVPGADPEHATRYWSALEKLPAGVSTPTGVCDRSEMFTPPRAHYSKLAKGLVRLFDHDCPWVGRCVGKGNHAAFVGMLLCGEVAMLCWQTSLYYAPPPSPYTSWSTAAWDGGAVPAAGRHARLAMCGVALMGLIHLMLTPLLVAHLYMASANVTTKEHFKYLQRLQASRPGRVASLPVPGTRQWKLYAPYDRGLLGNIAAFIRGDRDEAPKSGQQNSSAPSHAHHESHELLEVKVAE